MKGHSDWKLRSSWDEELQDVWYRDYLIGVLGTAGSRIWQGRRIVIKKGDVVLLEESGRKRYLWPLGIIDEVFYSHDGLVRSAKVRTREGTWHRPIQKIYKLEEPDGNDDTEEAPGLFERPVHDVEPEIMTSKRKEVSDKRRPTFTPRPGVSRTGRIRDIPARYK